MDNKEILGWFNHRVYPTMAVFIGYFMFFAPVLAFIGLQQSDYATALMIVAQSAAVHSSSDASGIVSTHANRSAVAFADAWTTLDSDATAEKAWSTSPGDASSE